MSHLPCTAPPGGWLMLCTLFDGTPTDFIQISDKSVHMLSIVMWSIRKYLQPLHRLQHHRLQPVSCLHCHLSSYIPCNNRHSQHNMPLPLLFLSAHGTSLPPYHSLAETCARKSTASSLVMCCTLPSSPRWYTKFNSMFCVIWKVWALMPCVNYVCITRQSKVTIWNVSGFCSPTAPLQVLWEKAHCTWHYGSTSSQSTANSTV